VPLPKYGAREGLADRLEEWKHRFGTDRSLPWPGLGLLEDLQAAADALNGKPEKPQPTPEPEPWETRLPEKLKQKIREFDL
jgi:hypothetical protein